MRYSVLSGFLHPRGTSILGNTRQRDDFWDRACGLVGDVFFKSITLAVHVGSFLYFNLFLFNIIIIIVSNFFYNSNLFGRAITSKFVFTDLSFSVTLVSHRKR